MNKRALPFSLLIIAVFLLACENTPVPVDGQQDEQQDEQQTDLEQVEVEQTDIDYNGSREVNVDWSDPRGPWNGSLYIETSDDGLSFSGRTLVLEHAGVPNLLMAEDGTLVLFYQYFSPDDEDLFDVIAYSLSEDDGATWSDPTPITFEGLPTGSGQNTVPMDPTVVQLKNGSYRLYFTYHAKNNSVPALYSATASDLSSSFEVEEEPALQVNGNLLDPAVIYFDGMWHHYTWQNDSDDNYHSTSKDGLSFTLQDEISLDMDFLGQVIAVGDGLRFYGTAKGGIKVASSDDGYTWEMDNTPLAQGADPAVLELEDGSFLMIYTSANFNQ